jgi:hypothetical protein
LQFTRVNSDPDETDGLLGVIDKVGLKKDKCEETFYRRVLYESGPNQPVVNALDNPMFFLFCVQKPPFSIANRWSLVSPGK